MIKREELADPKSCMSRAADDEMTFVLLGRDATAPATIRFWASERIRVGKNKPEDPQIVEALEAARRIEAEFEIVRLAAILHEGFCTYYVRANPGKDRPRPYPEMSEKQKQGYREAVRAVMAALTTPPAPEGGK